MAITREQTTVNFKVTSATVTAQDMLTRFGLKADRQWAAGAARGAFGAIEKAHGFELESTLGPQASLEEHIRVMLERLKPCAQKIGELVGQINAEFSCSLARRRAPMLHFERDVVRWLAVMGARLDIDTQLVQDSAPPAKAGGAGGASGSGGSGT